MEMNEMAAMVMEEDLSQEVAITVYNRYHRVLSEKWRFTSNCSSSHHAP